MRLAVIAVGRLKDGPERELCERYRERSLALGRGIGLSGPDIVEIVEGRGRPATARLEERLQVYRTINHAGVEGGMNATNHWCQVRHEG